MIRKFFPLDKNYILESTQLSLRDSLLHILLKKVKNLYEQQHNPLLLEDTFVLKIRTHTATSLKPLYGFYENLAGVYRYKFGETQLEFLWDGQDHQKKYETEWSDAFDQWTTAFCSNEQFLKAILDLTVFLPENRQVHMAENRMNYIILQHFDVKIHKSHGIVDIKVA